MTILNRNDAQPFTTADGSQIRELLNPRNAPLNNQSLAEATLLPNQCTAAHFHPQAEEIYFILEGRGTIEIEAEFRAVGVGDAIAIPNGQTHRICNDGEAILRFLCCCAPAYSHDDTVLVESFRAYPDRRLAPPRPSPPVERESNWNSPVFTQSCSKTEQAAV